MICPKCGTEYRDGFTECAYCHIALVESLEEGTDPEELLRNSERKPSETATLDVTPEEFMRIAREKGLSERDIANALNEMAAERRAAMPVESTDEAGDPEDEAHEDEAPEAPYASKEEENVLPVKPYRKAADRAEDLRSSAYTLLIAGVLGLIVVFLLYIGAFPIKLSGPGKFITTGTMAAMFILFLIIGINSARKVGPLTEEAEREEKKIEEIRKYFFSAYSAESIDREAVDQDGFAASEYFLRTSYMRKILNERFMDLDPAFLEFIVDDLYSEIYENASESSDEGNEADMSAPEGEA